MTVGNNNRRYSALHLDRTEVFSADPAVLFAELEVVEPIIGSLRKLASLFAAKETSPVNENRTDTHSADEAADSSPTSSSTTTHENRAA